MKKQELKKSMAKNEKETIKEVLTKQLPAPLA
jgi:hypothetical protein